MVTGKLKNGNETGNNKISSKLIKWEEKSSINHLRTHLKNMAGRDHTT
jgi:hypothetical protein